MGELFLGELSPFELRDYLLSVLVCQVCQFVGRTVMNHVLYDEPVRQDFVLFDEPVILYDEPSVKFVSVEFII